MPNWLKVYLFLLIPIFYLMLYTGAGDLWNKENLKMLIFSIIAVVFSYGIASLIVPFPSENSEVMITIIKPLSSFNKRNNETNL